MKFVLAILAGILLGAAVQVGVDKILTAVQVKVLALKLANDQAAKEYHGRPFHDGTLRQRTDGEWVWKNSCGIGPGDITAEVDLAPNGDVKGGACDAYNGHADHAEFLTGQILVDRHGGQA